MALRESARWGYARISHHPDTRTRIYTSITRGELGQRTNAVISIAPIRMLPRVEMTSDFQDSDDAK